MNGISNKNLMKLGELIKLLGHDTLEIRFYKHRQPTEELDKRMAKVPKRFNVRYDYGDGGVQWKHGVVSDEYGVESVSVTMFYSEKRKEVKK